jgi:squalene-hopene/tetraprenyl-beta-curcumene cyclase
MSPALDQARLDAAYQTALAALLAERTPDGHWVGELSTSALSTATAVSALALVQRDSPAPGSHDNLIAAGITWLAAHQNADGGWGDTVKSISNISTTMLGRAAFHITGSAERHADCLRRAEGYLNERCGPTAEQHAEAVRARYGKDRTFAVPILTTCALAGLVQWKEVMPLPFELACFPRSWYRFLQLPVVSYALPALIAIGQAVYHHRPPRNPITRLVRRLSVQRSLRVLEAIQPSSGGFLEATPLTSFVTLSLASIGLGRHPVARNGVEFLVRSVRPDGSWPIDTNLATWVTTLAVNALAGHDGLCDLPDVDGLRDWLLWQQCMRRHPYTGADPGGWGWTNLPGSVPDGDDTPGAILALYHLSDQPADSREGSVHRFIRYLIRDLTSLNASPVREIHPAAIGDIGLHVCAGLGWLLDLQNRDGGWPTFCRGWGNLPFDRSGTDLTAHALRAIAVWRLQVAWGWLSVALSKWFRVPSSLGPLKMHVPGSHRVDEAMERALAYLARTQRPDGSWLPLWFGNQYAPNDENPTYGTARVLAAYRDLDMMNSEPARRGVAWLLSAQNPDGGWGGAAGVVSSIEETALAVEVLLDGGPDATTAMNNGLAWLVQQVEAGGLHDPTPIGFYFAKLWYFEKLYPIIFTVAALGRALKQATGRREPAHREDPP